jgi:hypothetical protein
MITWCSLTGLLAVDLIPVGLEAPDKSGSSPASVGLVEVAVCACPWPDSVRWESAREGE